MLPGSQDSGYFQKIFNILCLILLKYSRDLSERLDLDRTFCILLCCQEEVEEGVASVADQAVNDAARRGKSLEFRS